MKYLITILFAVFLASSAQAKIVTETVEYKDGDATLQGYLAYDDSAKGVRPGVVVFHEWWGLNDYIKSRARDMASLGYVAFAPDVYGKGVRPANAKDAGNEAGKYMSDRALLRSRANAGLKVLLSNKLVDPKRVAATGYCFGGAAALELARSGAPIAVTVTFHGSLDTPAPDDAKNIKGSVLALHGADDTYVTADKVLAFQQEMRNAGIDWHMVTYGGAVHGFTNPANGADPSKPVAYNEKADKRSWRAMRDFLAEVFGQRK